MWAWLKMIDTKVLIGFQCWRISKSVACFVAISLSHVIACSCSWPSGWWIASITQKIFDVILWHTIPGENSLTHVYLPAAIHVDQISWHLVLLIDHKGPPPLHHSCPQRGPTWPIPCNKFGETDQGTIRTLAILNKKHLKEKHKSWSLAQTQKCESRFLSTSKIMWKTTPPNLKHLKIKSACQVTICQ